MGKAIALLYGLVCYLIFFVTFLYAIGFTGNFIVPKGIDSGVEGPFVLSIIINVALMGLFAVQHSVMARPGFKKWWTNYVPSPIERSTYVLLTSLALILLFHFWQPMTGTVWNITEPALRNVVWGIFAMGWGIVLLSTFMIGHFDLFGLQQVLFHKQGKKTPKPKFKEPGFYKLVRHPIMTGFIIAFWATPDMTMGHLLFAAVTTAYILIAIQLEERDLIALLGNAYINYRKRVPALIPFIKGSGRS
jgi:protein-S-isoprenylcysteine O-methyltransferase Ste14